MNRAERLRERGAITLVAILSGQLLIVGGAVAALFVAATTQATRAQAAADAAAHAAVAELAGDEGRQDFEIALQGGAQCLRTAADAQGGARSAGDDDSACTSAIAAARDAARSDGATLIAITVGPDPRAYVDQTVPAFFEVTVETEIPGPLDGVATLCAKHGPDAGFCRTVAYSAAREGG